MLNRNEMRIPVWAGLAVMGIGAWFMFGQKIWERGHSRGFRDYNPVEQISAPPRNAGGRLGSAPKMDATFDPSEEKSSPLPSRRATRVSQPELSSAKPSRSREDLVEPSQQASRPKPSVATTSMAPQRLQNQNRRNLLPASDISLRFERQEKKSAVDCRQQLCPFRDIKSSHLLVRLESRGDRLQLAWGEPQLYLP